MRDTMEGQVNKINLIILILGGLILSSCSSMLEPQEYLRWVESEDNGMFGIKTIENMEYRIHYKPHDYIALKSLLDNDISEFDKKKEELGDLQYFTFQLKTVTGSNSPLKYNLQTENEYYDRIAYLSFGIQKDLKLIENGDTLNCVLAVFERNYNIAPVSTFSLAFETKLGQHEIHTKEFVFTDKVFKNGPIRIQIKEKDIKNIPELKI